MLYPNKCMKKKQSRYEICRGYLRGSTKKVAFHWFIMKRLTMSLISRGLCVRQKISMVSIYESEHVNTEPNVEWLPKVGKSDGRGNKGNLDLITAYCMCVFTHYTEPNRCKWNIFNQLMCISNTC